MPSVKSNFEYLSLTYIDHLCVDGPHKEKCVWSTNWTTCFEKHMVYLSLKVSKVHGKFPESVVKNSIRFQDNFLWDTFHNTDCQLAPFIILNLTFLYIIWDTTFANAIQGVTYIT